MSKGSNVSQMFFPGEGTSMVLQKKKYIVADPVLTTREVFHAANLGGVF